MCIRDSSIIYYVSQSVFPLYLSHFSSELTETWHDDYLDGINKLLGSIGWQTMKLLLTLLSYVCSVHWLCLELQKECEKKD